MNSSIYESIFYHIYPLGFCGAPEHNDYTSLPAGRLDKVIEWIPHLKEMGITALYLGPLFESGSHGYDTVDYFKVDRRLGTNETLKQVARELQENGIKLILDGVFNHVGRAFPAFLDLQQKGPNSQYKDWFYKVNFNKRSPYNDPFSYHAWDGHYNLVKLNLKNEAVINFLFEAVSMWIKEFGIDGIRLDAADVLDRQFMKKLRNFTNQLKPDFWLIGEVVHGDYSRWIGDAMLNSTTNYECYKGLFSSHNDGNYFEIAHSLKRQFGEGGLYKNLPLYNFADNHDVNRVASSLKNKAHLYPLYILLMTMPGVPSLYYGSEWGLEGEKRKGRDNDLRPALELGSLEYIEQDLPEAVKKIIECRKNNSALKFGSYEEVLVQNKFFVFCRKEGGNVTLVAVNQQDKPEKVTIKMAGLEGTFLDVLNENEQIPVQAGKITFTIRANWGRILTI